MAKIRNNVIVRGASGSFGEQLVLKIDKAGRTILCNTPTFSPNRVFSPAQLASQEKFRQAAAYAKDARMLEVYVRKAEGLPVNSFNVALADWFRPPEIQSIDLSAWTGEAGQPIRVQARDDVEVKLVSVEITDENGTVLERGPAFKEDGGWWTYSTTAPASGNPSVSVTAEDLPGHTASQTRSLN